ncbi:DUF1801 domain-containing protein [Solimonas sp. K1W22B-7]|uniref:DUF1801 domain-containing protein n=1 Tax=Solimonas sp. K1W22B-7 TaxID=2303331 RepID=UPI000E3361B7|nr:DUF1801 domain-containing protein [Solimonas sp. K1W22B-7]AXQ30071.1 DUF1801 domain-containing protein [Solimonas sp. K1W22B-7]
MAGRKPIKSAKPAKATKKAAPRRAAAKAPAKAPARKAAKAPPKPAPKAKPARKPAPKPAAAKAKASPATPKKPVLLSGGNPQIAKGDGDAPVQAYIAAMPGWKREAGRRLDKLIARTVPTVRKAVKWNSPFYGMEGQGWFLAVHCFTSYIKVAFFRGSSLTPQPPVESKDPNARYFHIHEDSGFDEKQVANWIRQASQIPGWVP